VAYGPPVLARAVKAAGMLWDESQAHSAAYDAEITADIFCDVVNRFRPIFESARPQDWDNEKDLVTLSDS
jgi:ribonuclease T